MANVARASVASQRRQQILRAAAAVFSERGFAGAKVSEIARRADVAYGLVYHYFDSKEALLAGIFDAHWAVFLDVLRGLGAEPGDAPDKLRRVIHMLVDASRLAPEVVHVVIQEVSRSARAGLSEQAETFSEALGLVAELLAQGQRAGAIRTQVDANLCAYAFFGALEAVCVGVVLGRLESQSEGEADALKRSLEAMLLGGIETAVCRPRPVDADQ